MRTHRSSGLFSTRTRRLLAALIAFAVAAAIAGCRRTPARIHGEPRVVSLSPSTTEALFAIGAGSAAVGRSRFCDAPEEARALPVVGGYTDPSFEAILALAPTLVIGARGPAGPAIDERLRERGIATFFPATESIAEIEAMLLGLGQRLDREREATDHVARARERIERVGREVAALGKPRPRVLLLFDVEPVVAAGPGSFPDELLARAGGDNAVREGATYPVLGVERVLLLDPDVVLDTTVAMDKRSRIRKDAPGWDKLRAVREGKVAAVHDESVLRPGPRIGDAVTTLAKLLYPELAPAP